MDKQLAEKIHNEVIAAVNAIFAANGYKSQANNLRYDDANLTFKITAFKAGATNKMQLNRFASWMPDVDFDKLVEIPGKGKYKVVDYRARARKAPWIIMNVDTQSRLVISEASLKQFFKKA